MIKKIWHKISNIGVREGNSIDRNNKIKDLNKACFLAQLAVIYTLTHNFYFQQYLLTWIAAGSAIFLLSIYILNYYGHYSIALYLLISFVGLIIYISNDIATSASGIYLYYFSTLQAVIFLFHTIDNKKEIIYAVSILIIFILTTFFLEPLRLFENPPNDNITIQFKANIVLIILLNIVFLIISFKNKKVLDANLKSSLNAELNANKNLQKTVKDKDILMAELHHRVKNNLALINGLLTLQSRDTNSEEALMIIAESKNRIRSMAILHDKLYLKNSFDDVNLAEYIKEIVEQINVSIVDASNIEIHMKLDNVKVDISKGISIGLITNEIITNSLKHAFSNKDIIGIINIELKHDVRHHLKIIDNGKGLDEMTKRKNATSMGINIIGSLVDQIDGTYSITTDNDTGTYFDLYFQ